MLTNTWRDFRNRWVAATLELSRQLANVRGIQKDSWATIIGILQSDAEPEATLFAAITLRGKV
jgi:hypothetical protein